MQLWIRAGVYFGLVFSVGFLLGVVRVLWVVPSLGERTAEILETPLMLGASFIFAHFVVRRFPGKTRFEHLLSGAIALALLLAFEFTVVLGLRGLSVSEYLSSRDPVAGSVYAVSLLVFALLPWLVAGRRHGAAATQFAEHGPTREPTANVTRHDH
ncbi:MAG: hypothetical protein R3268_04695 [Acidiferrobacterales bacterium]|nr:hypothetical protein [Acidiferrobacterales bacterium]